jgi:anti-sigma factor RsiW
MKHAHVRDRLGPYLEGDLPLQQRALVDAHLDACESCAAELKELRGTIALLRSLPELEPPKGLAGRVMARIQAGEAQPSRWVRLVDGFDLLLRPRPLVVLVAASAGVLALTLLTPGFRTEPGEPQLGTSETLASSETARLQRLALPSVWAREASFAHLPIGSSADPEPSPLVSGLGALDSEPDRLSRDPSRCLEGPSQIPLAECDDRAFALAEEASDVDRAGKAARTPGTAEGFERTSGPAAPR